MEALPLSRHLERNAAEHLSYVIQAAARLRALPRRPERIASWRALRSGRRKDSSLVQQRHNSRHPPLTAGPMQTLHSSYNAQTSQRTNTRQCKDCIGSLNGVQSSLEDHPIDRNVAMAGQESIAAPPLSP